MNKQEIVHKLELLYNYLKGANHVCEHEQDTATFHEAAHQVDEIINWIKIND